MATYLLYGVMPVDKYYNATGTTYANARNATGGVTEGALAVGLTRNGNSFNGISAYFVEQTGYGYDLSSVVGTIASASLSVVPINGPSAGGPHAIRVFYNALTGTTATSALFLTGTQLDAATPATPAVSAVLVGADYVRMFLPITTPSLLTTTGPAWLSVVHQNTVANTTPTSFNYLALQTQDTAGTTNDPYMVVRSGHTVRAVGGASTTAAGNLSVSYPASVSVNDALVVTVTASDNVVSTMPAGWTLKTATNNTASLRTEVWWARAAGGETGTVTVTRSSGAAAVAQMIAVAGGNTSGDPIAQVWPSANANSSSALTGSTSTATVGALAAIVASAVAASNDLSAVYPDTQTLSSWTSSAFEEYDNGVEPRAYLAASIAADNASGATTLRIVVPSAALPGDVLLVWVTVRGTTTTVTRSSPAWTLHDSLSDGSTSITRLLWYVIPSSGGDQANGTVTFTLGTSQKASACMAVVRNANTTTPFNASSRQANASSRSCTVPTITPSAAATLPLVYGGTAIGTTANTSPASGFSPISYSVRVQDASTANQAATRTTSALYAPTANTTTGRQVSGSAIGSGVITFGAAARNVGWQVAIASASPSQIPVIHGMATFNAESTSVAAQQASLARSAVNTGILLMFAVESSGTEFTASVSAAVTTTGAAFEQARKFFAASITAAAAIIRRGGRTIVSTVSATAAAVTRPSVRRTASVTPTSLAAEQVRRALAASVISSTQLTRQARRAFSATLTAVSAIVEQTRRTLASSVTTTGIAARQSRKAAVASTALFATVAAFRLYARAVLAVIVSTALANKRASKSIAASVSAAASVARRMARPIAAAVLATTSLTFIRTFLRAVFASLSMVSSVARSAGKAFTSSVLSAAATAMHATRAIAAAVAASAQVGRVASLTKSLAASLAATASVSTIKALLRLLSASTAPSAALAAVTARVRTFSATLLAEASVTQRVSKSVSALLVVSAAVRLVATRFLSASIAASAAVGKAFAKTASASLTAVATVSERVGKTLLAVVETTALATVQVFAGKAATVAAATNLSFTQSLKKALNAAVSPSAVLTVAQEIVNKALSASIAAAAAVSNRSAKALAATVTPSTTIVQRVAKGVQATLTLTAAIFIRNARTVGAALAAVGTVTIQTARSLAATVTGASTVLTKQTANKRIQRTVIASSRLIRSVRKYILAVLQPLGILDGLDDWHGWIRGDGQIRPRWSPVASLVTRSTTAQVRVANPAVSMVNLDDVAELKPTISPTGEVTPLPGTGTLRS